MAESNYSRGQTSCRRVSAATLETKPGCALGFVRAWVFSLQLVPSEINMGIMIIRRARASSRMFLHTVRRVTLYMMNKTDYISFFYFWLLNTLISIFRLDATYISLIYTYIKGWYHIRWNSLYLEMCSTIFKR